MWEICGRWVGEERIKIMWNIEFIVFFFKIVIR